MEARAVDEGRAIVSSRFRIISANLANGRADAVAFGKFVQALEPDAVALQELRAEQADALAAVMRFGKLDPKSKHAGMGIALRQPGRVWRLPLPRRDAYVAELLPARVPGIDPVEIINVHIVGPHVWPLWRTARLRHGQLRSLERYLDACPHRPGSSLGISTQRLCGQSIEDWPRGSPTRPRRRRTEREAPGPNLGPVARGNTTAPHRPRADQRARRP